MRSQNVTVEIDPQELFGDLDDFILHIFGEVCRQSDVTESQILVALASSMVKLCYSLTKHQSVEIQDEELEIVIKCARTQMAEIQRCYGGAADGKN